MKTINSEDCEGCMHLIYEKETNAYICTSNSQCDKQED